MTLEQQIDGEIRRAEDKIRDLQVRYQADLTVLDARLADLKVAKKAVKGGKELEDALRALEKVGILNR